jgi:hypothetical protein
MPVVNRSKSLACGWMDSHTTTSCLFTVWRVKSVTEIERPEARRNKIQGQSIQKRGVGHETSFGHYSYSPSTSYA